MSDKSKFVAAVVGLFVTAIVFSRQLFLFTVLRDAQGLLDAQGRYHLGLAVSAGIAACIAGGLMFHFFLRLQKIIPAQVSSAPVGTLNTVNNTRRPTPSAAVNWPRPNLWLSEGQADDRMPMNSAVADSGGATLIRPPVSSDHVQEMVTGEALLKERRVRLHVYGREEA